MQINRFLICYYYSTVYYVEVFIMHTIDLIAQRTSVLPNNLQQEVLDFVEFLFAKNGQALQGSGLAKSRKAGLHTGNLVLASDFNEALPDDFWVGNE
jgi:hypothetical protein